MLTVSVLGCGVWGRNHTRVFSELPGVHLKTVVDLDKNKAIEISKRYNVGYELDPNKVIADPEIDLVTICTPTITHYDLALRAIEAGKHVLVEKPMTDTVEEAEEIIRAAYKEGVHLSVGFIERFNPAVQEAKKLIDQNRIGEVILINAKRVSRWPRRIGDVGVIKDLSIHDIDIINNIFGIMPKTVFTTAGSIKHGFEDYSNIMLCFKNQKGGFVETNWLTPRKIRTLIITGTEGIINIEYITQTLSIETKNHIIQPFIDNGEPLRLELESLIKNIGDDKPPEITGEDGLKALKVCEAALKSAEQVKPVKLDQNNKEF
jgi:UDP-N-acetylglucosamine 3-dehydrogenase